MQTRRLTASVSALLLCCVLTGGSVLAAESEQSADGGAGSVNIENNPYFVALLQIGLQKEQVPRFKELIGQYAGDRQNAIDDAIRSREGNLESRVRRSKAKLETRFFADMEKLLNQDQFSRFPAFNEELDRMLLERESLAQDNDAQSIFPTEG